MRKIKYSSSFILIVILAISINISGCEQEDLDFYVNCYDCLDFPPDSAELIVYLTINEENTTVPLVLYLGDYEENVVHSTIIADNDTTYIYAEVGISYSAKATYLQEGEPIVAIDGDKLRVIDGDGECDPPCYVIRGGTLDLRLK